jgi:acyl-coenzyme A synthetase/AMP-(fatty) acid ligase
MYNFILNSNLCEIELEILQFIKRVDNKEDIQFTTSGTTGSPKTIIHKFETLTKNIKINDSLRESIWGLTYDPTKIAASQVILQSYLNGGKIVNLFGKPVNEVAKLITQHNITHISATPTFYRLLIGIDIFKSVKQITISGESVSESLIEKIKLSFPNCRVTNVYALTEFGTLFSSKGVNFTISPDRSNFIKIEKNHLFVKKDTKWIDTGDIVEMVGLNTFKIVGREVNMINVGGIKVNPIYVEDVINRLEYVNNSYVYSHKNSVMGNVIIADIILKYDIDMNTLRNDLKNRLNKYEVPIKINIVDSFKLNSNGKVVRK